MAPNSPSPSDSSLQATVHHAAAPVLWLAIIDGEPEATLLPRLLQKLVCQGAAIQSLRYELNEEGDAAQLEILMIAEPARARLLAKKWETIVTVHRVILCPVSTQPVK